MEARTVHLHVDIVVDGSAISGQVAILGGGPVRRFAGRLGLITAIEDALDGPGGDGASGAAVADEGRRPPAGG